MAGRQYSQREWRLLSWWASTFHPAAEWWLNLRVGPTLPLIGVPVLTAALERLSRVRNRYVDGLYLEGGELNLVEAKLQPDPGIFSQLLHYGRLLRADPAWREFAHTPLNLIALVYNNDESVAEEAPLYGVRWIVYQPNLAEFPPALTIGPPAGSASAVLPAGFGSWVTALTSAQSSGVQGS
jgi:hypothetical protein